MAAIDLPRAELATTIDTICTALVAARDLDFGEAAVRAVRIIVKAFAAADAILAATDMTEQQAR